MTYRPRMPKATANPGPGPEEGEIRLMKKEMLINVLQSEECRIAEIRSPADILDSKVRPSFFVRDPDGNMMEFGERGKGEF